MGADTSPTETLADDEILSELSFTATLHGRWPDRFLQRQSKKNEGKVCVSAQILLFLQQKIGGI